MKMIPCSIPHHTASHRGTGQVMFPSLENECFVEGMMIVPSTFTQPDL